MKGRERMELEIERKYMLNANMAELQESGTLKVVREQRIEQTYLAIDEDQELRVRRLTDVASGEVEYTHTFKRGNGLIREEVEYSISAEIYEQLIRSCGAVPLTKNRMTAEFNGRKVEIDVYDQLQLTVLEVEFRSEQEAAAFRAPDWFGQDISTERQYSNKQVWSKLQEGRV